MPTRPRIPWVDLVAALLALALVALCVSGCSGKSEPQRGTAASTSVDAQARAGATTEAADLAALEQARAEAAAANAEAAAALADQMAVKTPTPELIERAAAARVAAVQAAADARTAAAVARAQRQTAESASKAARAAAEDAMKEREAEATAARQDSLRRWCGYVATGLLLAGLLGGLLLGYLGMRRLGILAATAGTVLAAALPLFAASLPWIEAAAPWLLLALLAGGVATAVWCIRHLADVRRIVATDTHAELPPRLSALAQRLGWQLPIEQRPTEQIIYSSRRDVPRTVSQAAEESLSATKREVEQGNP